MDQLRRNMSEAEMKNARAVHDVSCSVVVGCQSYLDAFAASQRNWRARELD